MAYLTFFSLPDGKFSIGIQPSLLAPTHYYPAVKIDDGHGEYLYPVIASLDEVDDVLALGLTKPPCPTQKLALGKHNLKYYQPSATAQTMFGRIPNIPALEQMVKEQTYLEEHGIAFSPDLSPGKK